MSHATGAPTPASGPDQAVRVAGLRAPPPNPTVVRKAAGIAFLLVAGICVVLSMSYLLLLVEFDLPLGPPLVLLGLVALSFALVARLASRR